MNLRAIRYGGERKQAICDLCVGKTVLHLGCAAAPDTLGRLDRGEHLHARLSTVTAELHGIDTDWKGLQILQSRGFKNLHHGNAEQLQTLALEKVFDVVVAAELIEHLNTPIEMLRQLKRLMRQDSQLIVSTPNALSVKFFLHALTGREVSGPDHIAIFSPAILKRLLERSGFEVIDIYGTIESHSGWRNRVTRGLFKFFFRLAPWFSDALVLSARLKDEKYS
jgi:2-polyprenyl-3-methyl-5-hydroxy-6-metoxy-1,4-benzoquinol methylase